MLITAYDAFHRREMERFISRRDVAIEIRTVLKREHFVNVPNSDLYRNTELLRLFMFDFLRAYLVGQNVKSFFLPAVKFFGRTTKSPMIHFCVICAMENLESAQVMDEQSAGDFVSMDMVTAEDRGLTKGSPDPTALLANSWVGR